MKEAEKKDKKAVEQDEAEKLKKDEDLQNELNEEEIREKEVSETCEKEEKTLEEELECLKKENADLKDQYLRKLAEFDNYRKRMIKESKKQLIMQTRISCSTCLPLSMILTVLFKLQVKIQAKRKKVIKNRLRLLSSKAYV